MKLLELRIENFGPFRSERILLDGLGLTLLLGLNRTAVNADSNGSGKSSIIEAILFCFFGETIKAVNADDVVNRDVGKNCRVFLSLFDEDENKYYSITRYRLDEKYKNEVFVKVKDGSDPNAEEKDIRAEGAKGTQKLIEKILGLDFDTFTNSVIFPQGLLTKFSEASDSEQKAILEKILNVEFFAHCQDTTKAKMKDLGQELAVQQNYLNLTVRDLEREQKLLTDLKSKEASFEKNKDVQLRSVGDRIHKMKQECEALEQTIKDIIINSLSVEEVEVQIAQAKSKLALIQAGRKETQDRVRKEIVPLEGTKSVRLAEVERIKKELRGYKSLEGLNCPTCKRPVGPEHVSDLSKDQLARGKAAKAEAEELVTKIAAIHQEIEDLVAKSQAQETELQLYIENQQKEITKVQLVQQSKASKERELANKTQQMDELYKEYKRIESTKSDFAGLIRSAENKLIQLQEEQTKLTTSIPILEKELKHLSFWETGFGNKGLKSLIIDSAVPFLEESANRYSQILTGGDIRIAFNTQVQNQKKEWKEKFEVAITHRTGGDSYRACSGGERKRVDLCITLALQELVSHRSTKKYNLAIFDEVFESLDESGVDAAILLLNQIAREKSSVLVVSHDASLKARFTDTLTVVKENGISFIANG